MEILLTMSSKQIYGHFFLVGEGRIRIITISLAIIFQFMIV